MLSSPCCISATSAAPQWACPIAPNRADSHNGTASKLSLRAQKQKIGPCCNFFAIRDCYGSLQPQAGSQKRRWSAAKWLFFALQRRRGAPNRKKLQKRSDFCFCGRWIAAAGQIPQRVDRRSGGGSRKGRVAAAGQIIQRAGSARSGVSVRIHFATRFACDDDTVCVTECAPFWLAPTLWG